MKKLLAITVSILFIAIAISLPCYAGNGAGDKMLSATETVVTGAIINGCYKNGNGQLRILPNAGQCLPSEMPISWNLAGPAGPQGPQGLAGLRGPAGEQGLPGSAGPTGMEVTYVQENMERFLTESHGTADVFCESGDMVITGGCDIIGDDPQWVLQKTLPLFDVSTDSVNPKDGWSCTYAHITLPGFRIVPVQITAIVMCADLTP